MPKKTEPETGRRLSYRYRIYPTPEQEAQMCYTLGGCQFVYNRFLRERIDAYERTQPELRRPEVVLDENGRPKLDNNGREVYRRDDDGKVIYTTVPNENYDPNAKPLTRFDTGRMLTQLKNSLPDKNDGHLWLNDIDAVALNYSLIHLDRAYQNFFQGLKKGQKIGFPKFKNHKNPMLAYTTKVQLVGRDASGKRVAEKKTIPSDITSEPKLADVTWTHIYVPKIGDVKAKIHRLPQGTFVAASISTDAAGRWFCSLNVKEADDLPETRAAGEVGITFGASRWVTDSAGGTADMPEGMRRRYKRKIRAQRDLSRMVEGSNNWKKQKKKLARIEASIADCRRNATHDLTHRYVMKYDTICTREMQSKKMAQHKRGATEKLPRRVQHHLNRLVMDNNFFEVNRQLAYKADWNRRAFALVPCDTPTAQVCHDCGYKETLLIDDLRPTWTCPACGTRHDRKNNGADNVLDAGLDILNEQALAYVTKEREAMRKKTASKKTGAKKQKKTDLDD